MRKFFTHLLILSSLFTASFAEDVDKYSMRVAWGYASEKDLGDILLNADLSSQQKNLTMIAIDGGYLLYPNISDLPFDLYLKGGFSYFNEDKRDDTYEALVYLKLLYNLDFLDNRVRFGFGEGVSLVKDNLETELIEADRRGIRYGRFLNYLDITLDVDLGKLFRYKPMENLYFGYLLKHRSGVFGLFNGVHGGSNYNSFYLEKNF
ncbi:hypothetical protein [Sulfurimonas sp. C5]|uniref:hypothetical protein n=1 Tax=Sulfurimonas sp. C5 TaxID=3036947 RepID=UPI002455DD2D|nr:hypothetical protein [Sulfurimonas sp. C5]MDH4945420.1 hypothetical protein [Sulfurimonas sp. C5]